MRLFNGSYDAIETVKNKHICDKDYSIAIKYISMSSLYSCEAIKLKLYRNEKEFNELFEAVSRSPYDCVYLYKNCYDILSDEQISIIFKTILSSPAKCFDLLSYNKNIDKDSRYKLLDSILLCSKSLEKLFNDNCCNDEEILYVLKKIKNYKNLIFNFLISESCNKNNKKSYDYAVSIILLDENYSYKIVNEKKHSSNKELISEIYKLYGELYYNKLKRKFYDYFDFCIAFGFCLNDTHQKLLVKKLMTKKYKHYINYIVNLVDLNKKNLDLINSYLLIDNLK